VGYLNGVKGYRLIDPLTDQILIQPSVKFEESPSHAPHEPHEEAFVLPPFAADESIHSYHTLDLSSDIESEDIEDADARSRHSYADLVHAKFDSVSPMRTRSQREIYEHPSYQHPMILWEIQRIQV